MSYLPVIVGIEDQNGNRVDEPRPDGIRGPVMLKLGSGFSGSSSFSGNPGITKVTLGFDFENVPGGEDGEVLTTASGAPTWSQIVDAHVSAAAAIAGTKVSPDFGSQNVQTTGWLAVGAGAAQSGEIRLPNDSTIRARNGGGDGDVRLLSISSGNEVRLGEHASNAHVRLGSVTGALWSGGITCLSWTSGLVSSRIGLGVGTDLGTVASSGDLRVRSGFTLQGRNSGDSANATLVSWRADNLLEFGSANFATRVSGSTLVQAYVGGSLALSISTGIVASTLPLGLGAAGDRATTGDLRVRNGFVLAGRNQANNDNVSLLDLTTDNALRFGGTAGGSRPGTIIFDAASSFEMMTAGSPRLIVTGSGIRSRVATIRWDNTVTDPVTLTQQAIATPSATGQSLTVAAQSCSGASSVGGDVFIMPGTGVADNGQGRLRTADNGEAIMWGGTAASPRIGFFNTSPAPQRAIESHPAADVESFCVELFNILVEYGFVADDTGV